MTANVWTRNRQNRRYFIGGSDARINYNQEAARLRLSDEKRGEIEPEDRCGNLIVQFGVATEGPNRRWYECMTDRMPVGWYIASITYATAVILVECWPWNILLILLLFPSRGFSRGSSL
jgi:hypothetical protein